MSAANTKKIRITLVKSAIARPGKHKAVLIGLGLKKLNKSVIRPDSPEIRGMINKVSHLLQVESA
jgi:large subunit ribosomal protein L30